MPVKFAHESAQLFLLVNRQVSVEDLSLFLRVDPWHCQVRFQGWLLAPLNQLGRK